MRVDVEGRGRIGARATALSTSATTRAGRDIQHRRIAVSPLLHRGDELGVGASAVRRHLQVETRLEREHAVDDGAPVRDDEPVEAPLVAQHGRQQPRVARDAWTPLTRLYEHMTVHGCSSCTTFWKPRR